jgi:hypothetical protein
VHKKIISVKRVEFTSDKTSYIMLKTFMPCQRIKVRNWNVFDKLHKYHMKILLGGFNAKIGREDILKPKNLKLKFTRN